MKIFVQFSDPSKAIVSSVFGCAQGADEFPHQGEISTDDARYLAFLYPVVIPSSVSRFQAFSALDDAGEFDAIDALMARPETPLRMKRAWVNAQVFERDSDTVEVMRVARGWTHAQVDALFIAAENIKA